MEKELKDKPKKKDRMIELTERYFAWEEKKIQKKALKEEKSDKRWGKFRLIKNKRIRAGVWLGIFVMFILWVILFL